MTTGGEKNVFKTNVKFIDWLIDRLSNLLFDSLID